jgi:short-subunit dehydrogenase
VGVKAPARPHKAVYAADKTFVLNFTLVLREELRGTGVRASVRLSAAV